MQLFTQIAGSRIKGLKAEYFDNIRLKGAPSRTVIDTIVNIGNGWHIAAENKGIPYDHCSCDGVESYVRRRLLITGS